ncbi:MAG: PBP1A family penicillin-binding protein [Lachnospiraceae bacterium]|nr:PBP1A family penicillin-binding protein [Lachnospiraceae bacterium]
MNYSKKGVRAKQTALGSKSKKWGRKAALSIMKLCLLLLLGVGIIGISAGIGVFKGIISTAPDISNIDVSPSGFSSFVYDSEGHQIEKLVAADSNRIPVSMEQIPEDLAHAFVAIEDERFYEHNGIDIKGIMRAGVQAIKNRGLGQGASTITQQLLKNNVFDNWTNESTMEKIKRKIQEQYLAIALEKQFTETLGRDAAKDKILENYMNTINLGQNTLGVQAASLRYFNKPVYQLNLSECACIAAITQNPSKWNPISHPDRNKERRDIVLGNMLEQGYISQAEYDEAIADDIYARIQTVNEETKDSSVYTYFVDELTEQVLNDLVEKGGYNETQAYNLLYTGGVSIFTTQDPDIQKICDDAFSNPDNFPADTKWYLQYELTIEKANGDLENFSNEMFKSYFLQQKSSFNSIFSSQEDATAAIEEYKASVLGEGDEVYAESINMSPQPQVSITVMDQSTGYVVALVGGRGAKEASRTLNRATNTVRQPGSTFKIVSTYAPALDSAGMTLATVQNDAPYNYANGRPVQNWYSSGYKGLCSLRYGIEQSLNIVTVKTLTQITPQLGFDYLQHFGFTTLVEREERNGQIVSDIGQPLALGGITDGVTNLELNAAYAAIANHGTYIKPTLYTKVVDHDGNVILDNTQPESHQVIKETTAFLLTDAMVDVVTKGTGARVNFGNMAIAGKTGTTTKDKDAWFAGFTPYYTATTWAGYDNNVSLSGDEKNLAKNLWRAVMSQIHADLPNESFTRPAGIVTATICSKSGKLPIAGLCDTQGCLRTEYFAEGTVPTETCDVHYSGVICQYSMLPACEECPFKVPGTIEMIPPEPSVVQSGADSQQSVINSATDPLMTGETTTSNVTMCPHNAEFFQQPNASAIVEQQRLEILQSAGLLGADGQPVTQTQAQTPTTGETVQN